MPFVSALMLLFWPGAGLPGATPKDATPLVAIDGNGVPHTSYNYQYAAWRQDVIRLVKPDYPVRARIRGQEGAGVFRLTIDLKGGSVQTVATIESTKSTYLDQSALVALRQWRLRSGTWKQIDVRVIFAVGKEPDSNEHFPFPSSAQSIGRGVTP